MPYTQAHTRRSPVQDSDQYSGLSQIWTYIFGSTGTMSIDPQDALLNRAIMGMRAWQTTREQIYDRVSLMMKTVPSCPTASKTQST